MSVSFLRILRCFGLWTTSCGTSCTKCWVDVRKDQKKSHKLLTRIYLKVGFPISVFFFLVVKMSMVHGEKPDTINSNLQRIVSMILRKKTFYISSELF